MKEYIFRDPIHGHISVRDATVLALVDSPEFQRLRRVRQLGASFISYPGAEHTRFAHSLGVYHLMGRVLRHLRERDVVQLDPDGMVMAQCAALLHDIGHGPFSHAFEKITGSNHEQWTRQIITVPETEVAQALAARDPAWPDRVAQLLNGAQDGAGYLPGLISSQVDVDRMDYLLRDAFMCGVPYGQYDLDRLVHTLTVHRDGTGDRVVISEKGQHAAEEFLLARYFMYWNVYFHKATRAVEIILEKLLQRAISLVQAGAAGQLGDTPAPVMPLLLGRPLDLREYLSLDETDILFTIKRWTVAPDPVLSDLSRRFINRRLLGGIRIDDRLPQVFERWGEVEAAIRQAGFPAPEYYSKIDETSNRTYSYYVFQKETSSPPILVLSGDEGHQQLREISSLSEVLRSISAERVTRHTLYVPKEAIPGIQAVLEA